MRYFSFFKLAITIIIIANLVVITLLPSNLKAQSNTGESVDPKSTSCLHGSKKGDKSDGFYCVDYSGNYSDAQITCPDGSTKTENGSIGGIKKYICKKKNTSSAQPTCPNGFTLEPGFDGVYVCSSDTQNTRPTCPEGRYLNATNSECTVTPPTTKPNCPSGFTAQPEHKSDGRGSTYISGYSCKKGSEQASPSGCQSGYKLSDNGICEYVKPENSKEEDAPSCNIDSMGWIICPTMTVVARISDSALSVIISFLTIKPSILDMGSKTHEAWSYFRNIANVLFAVMFMWVIFSQVSNVGISNYGIKKMLPKLIIGAILVNASFIICQGAVDLSNVLGNALSDFFDKIAGSVQSTEAAGVGETFSAVILGGLALTGALALAFLAISVPTLLAVLLVLISVVVILIARQAIVILLIAISPVAFVAWLLPNTEGLFKKWLGLLKGMLVVFPIISLLYGAGRLASAVLNNAAGDAGTVDAFGMQIAALGASVIPLGATPLVLRSSLNSLGAIGGKLGGLTGMANKNLMGAVSGKSRLGDLGRKVRSDSAQRQANRRAGNGVLSRAGKKLSDSDYRIARGFGRVASSIGGASARLDTSPLGQAFGLDKGVYAAQDAADKAADEAALRELTYKYNGDAVLALENSGNSHVQKMAVKQLAEKGEWGAIQMAEYLRSGHAVTSVGMAEAMSGMKGYHAGVGAAGTETLKSLQANPGTPVSFEPEKLDSITVDALAKMSAESISKQSADAIKSVDTLKNSSTASPDDLANIQKVQKSAAVILGSDRLKENTKGETIDILSKL